MIGECVAARLEEDVAERLPPALRDQIQKCYRVTITDDKDRKGSFAACLVKLQDRLFLDILPDDEGFKKLLEAEPKAVKYDMIDERPRSPKIAALRSQ